MSESQQIVAAFDSRVQRREDRRNLFKAALGIAAVSAGGFVFASQAAAQTVTDNDVLNFALNLEYLEANFYYYAAYGTPIPATSITGVGTAVPANTAATAAGVLYNAGARAVSFSDRAVGQYAREIAQDELAHVNFLRSALTTAAVAQPALDIGIRPTGAFSTAARAAGLIADAGAGNTQTSFFDPYANDLNFLYGAFLFEDVGVTAYKGASPLLTNKTYLDAAAGILAAEAYHASIVRTVIDRLGANPGLKAATIRGDTELVSNARDSLDGSSDLDQGLNQTTTGVGLTANIAPTDGNGIAFSRTTGQVLNIVYLSNAAVTAGGFFPAGVNGTVRTSTAQA